MKPIKKYLPHVLLWCALIGYFVFAPDLFVAFFTSAGKPLPTEKSLPSPSKRISFVIDGQDSYIKDGQSLHNIYGWGYIAPEQGETMEGYVPEIALVSENDIYFFAVKRGYRNPGPQSAFGDNKVDFYSLGFNTLIAEDSIKPGKYRIAMVFKNPSTGSAFYWDKPARYLIKTPNTLTLKK
jgi:hypothetical protein